MSVRRLTIFCGSRPGADPAYLRLAQEVGTLFAQRGIGVVYGGGGAGMMGAVADAALAVGGEVFGVMPRELVRREQAHAGLTELRLVDSMHERKALMESLGDGFVALPGGMGTLEEISEALTWAQLGIHHKPCALLDVKDYWAPLRASFDQFISQGFLRPEYGELLLHSRSPEDLLDQLEVWKSPAIQSWVSRYNI